jgi:hypothetical protein
VNERMPTGMNGGLVMIVHTAAMSLACLARQVQLAAPLCSATFPGMDIELGEG